MDLGIDEPRRFVRIPLALKIGRTWSRIQQTQKSAGGFRTAHFLVARFSMTGCDLLILDESFKQRPASTYITVTDWVGSRDQPALAS